MSSGGPWKKPNWSSWDSQSQPYWSSGYATTTPPRRSTSYENVMSSPHGTDQHDISLPNDFKSSQQCLDENVIGGRKLFRKIQLTAWSQKVNLSGRNVGDVRLHELCWQGWRNWHLRLLSAGQFVTGVFCRKVHEAVLMHNCYSSSCWFIIKSYYYYYEVAQPDSGLRVTGK